MPTTILCQGYTTYAKIDDSLISMLGFDVSLASKPMISQGGTQYGSSVNSVTRTKGAFYLDVPTISCKVNFEPDKMFVERFINKIRTQRNAPWKLAVFDNSTSVEWEFTECYLRSFSFSVSAGSILSFDADFYVVTDSIYYEWTGKTVIKKGVTLPPLDISNPPIAYYRWGVDLLSRGTLGTDENPIDDLTGFNFSFSQEITPKRECIGSNDKIAPVEKHLIFGLPQYNFSYQHLPVKSGSIDYRYNAGKTAMSNSELDESCVIIKLDGNELFRLTGAVEVSASPSWNGFQNIERTMSIHGTMK